MKHLFFSQKFFDARVKLEEENKKTGPYPVVSLYVNAGDEVVIATQASMEGVDIPGAHYMGQENQFLRHIHPSKIVKRFGKTKDEIMFSLNKNKERTMKNILKIK